MTEKSFLEILSEKIEQRVRSDISQSQNSTNNPSIKETLNEKSTQNVDNFSSGQNETPLNDTLYSQWMNQIPMGKIHFSPPRQQVFGRLYPVNTPRPKEQAPRQKHLLNEKQMQSIVYFWGFQVRLKDDFTLTELKKAFRSLAHKLHPDRNDGKTKAFIELKAHYQCLLSVFKS